MGHGKESAVKIPKRKSRCFKSDCQTNKTEGRTGKNTGKRENKIRRENGEKTG